MIDYTQDPFYDIRKLPCGGWSSSKISVQSHGKWLQFREPNSKEIINSIVPVNYSKRYRPPKSIKINNYSNSNQSETDSSFSDYITSFLNKKKVIKKEEAKFVVVPQIEFDPERVAIIVNDDNREFSKNETNSRPNSSSQHRTKSNHLKNSQNENSKNQIINDCNLNSSVNFVFNETDLPKSARIIQKRKGDVNMKKSFGAHHSSYNNNKRPSTALKPEKTYIGHSQIDNGLIVIGNRPKTSLHD